MGDDIAISDWAIPSATDIAFELTGVDQVINDRIGILAGSLLLAVIGYFVLRWVLRATDNSGESVKTN